MNLISKQNDDYSYTPLCLTKRYTAEAIHRLFGSKVASITTGEALVSIGMTDSKPVHLVSQTVEEIGKGGCYLAQEVGTQNLIGVCTENHHQELLDYFKKLGYEELPFKYQITKMKIL